MKKIYKLVFLEVIPSFITAFFVITFLVLIVQFNKFSKLLFSSTFTIFELFKFIILLLPNVLFISIPVSFLIGIVIGINNLYSENSITAINSSGVSTIVLLRPIFYFSIFVYLFTTFITFYILPTSNRSLRELKYTIASSHFISEIEPREFYTAIPDLVIYVDDINPKDMIWHDIIIFDDRDKDFKRIYTANSGNVIFDKKSGMYQVFLKKGVIYKVDKNNPENEGMVNFKVTIFPLLKVDLKAFEKLPLKRYEMTMSELYEYLKNNKPDYKNEKYIDNSVEFYQRLSLPLVVFLFGFLGLPIGLLNKKGGKFFGYSASILIVLIYYLSFVYIWKFGVVHRLFFPSVGVWIPFFFFLICSIFFLLRVKEGKYSLPFSFRFVKITYFIKKYFKIFAFMRFKVKSKEENIARTKFYKKKLLKKLDIYSIKYYFTILFFLMVSIISIFIIFTLFELIDEIYKNKIPLKIVAEYFLNFIPYLIYLLFPISILLSSMIFFYLLEKNNELLALKANGISVYRVITIILFLGIIFSLLFFVMQEFFLPSAKKKQEILLSRIKGKNVLYSSSNGFYYKNGNIIIKYDILDLKNKKFINFNLYEIDKNKLKDKFCSKNAIISPFDNSLFLNKCIVKKYFPEKSFKIVEKEKIKLPFLKSLLKKHESKISEMSFIELKKYEKEMRLKGYDTLGLKIRLWKKFSYPMLNFTILLLGIPLFLLFSSRNVFKGFTLGIFSGVLLWIFFSLFISLGVRGVLPIFLSVWGIHIIFIFSGIYFLTLVRT